MADEITPTPEGTTEQAASIEQPGNGDDRTFTQDEVNRIVADRLKRAKSALPPDYDDLKAKAAKLDELEAANKSDLERANDATAKAKAKADEWKAKFEALQADQERAAQVVEMAARYKVDQGTLSRMSGDVEDNAKFLAGIEAARPKYPAVADEGDKGKPSMTRAEILAERDRDRRLQLIAEHMDLFE